MKPRLILRCAKFYSVNLFTDSFVKYHGAMNRIDHLIVAADSLEQGQIYLRERLGVELAPGGRHAAMATHNRLMRLGDELYLELIAIAPAAAPPQRPRWFGLDAATTRAALRREPRLVTWAINTPDIHRLVAGCDFDVGDPTRLERDALAWDIALTDDGRLLADGLLPYVLQWHSQPHPAGAMADRGCRLRRLALYHNRPGWLRERLVQLGVEHLVEIEALPDDAAPFIAATIDTPELGPVTLYSDSER